MAGAVYARATLPYTVSKTCAGHATIGTGAYPSTHGMIDNDWYDAAAGGFVSCTQDPRPNRSRSVRAAALNITAPDRSAPRHSATNSCGRPRRRAWCPSG